MLSVSKTTAGLFLSDFSQSSINGLLNQQNIHFVISAQVTNTDDDYDVGRDQELLTVWYMMMWRWFTKHSLPVVIKLTLLSNLTNSILITGVTWG